jgi:hypothetical protein
MRSDCSAATGCPIQTSPDQRSFASSPELFAGCRVFLRLWTPRHPPCTLTILTASMTSCPTESLPPFSPPSTQHILGARRLRTRRRQTVSDSLWSNTPHANLFSCQRARRPFDRRPWPSPRAPGHAGHVREHEATRRQPDSAADRDWSRPGSNRQPLACKASALPIELRPRFIFRPSTAQPQPSFPQPPGRSSSTKPATAKTLIQNTIGVIKLHWARVDSNY